MKQRTMNFFCSTFYDKKVMEGCAVFVHYSSPKVVDADEYQLYREVLESYVKAATRNNFDIAQIVSDVRDLFKGSPECTLNVRTMDGKKLQDVKYGDSVECSFENKDWDDKVIVKDERLGFTIDFFKEKSHMSLESEKEVLKEVRSYIDKIIELKGMEPNKNEDKPTIFGYTPEKIKEQGITFDFGLNINGKLEIKINSKNSNTPKKPKSLSYDTNC